ncbi:MAG: hypothetical protein V1809_01945 [Planctomycetota bacterium]
MRYAKDFSTRWKMALVAEIFVVVSLSGCAVRAVMVPVGEPVRLRETVRNAKVWVADKDGKEIPSVVDLPEGWYCLPDEGEECERLRSQSATSNSARRK